MKSAELWIGILTAFGAAFTTSAITVGQIDTFEDGTTQGWTAGLLGAPHPAPPVNSPSGGPLGSDDNFLLVTSLGGSGPGSRLSAISFSGQWAGDYLAAGVGGIAMDVRNLGNSDLYLRLSFSDPTIGPPGNIAFSSEAIYLPAGGDWAPVVFALGLSDLTSALGSVDTALRNATELRIYHSQVPNAPNPVGPIEPINALLGIDNIRAVPGATRVPDTSSTALLLGIALLTIGGFRLSVVSPG